MELINNGKYHHNCAFILNMQKGANSDTFGKPQCDIYGTVITKDIIRTSFESSRDASGKRN